MTADQPSCGCSDRGPTQPMSEADLDQMLKTVRATLSAHGVEFDATCCTPGSGGGGAGSGAAGVGAGIKVVCIAPDMRATVDQLGQSTRDQVVMVRIDAATSQDLDAWVETGAVRSRSEAAALFIREGLGLRRSELEQFRDALGEVEQAKARLRQRAREVFGQPESADG